MRIACVLCSMPCGPIVSSFYATPATGAAWIVPVCSMLSRSATMALSGTRSG